MFRAFALFGLLSALILPLHDLKAADDPVFIGSRPLTLIDQLDEGALKTKLLSCQAGPFTRSDFSIGHRGAPLQYPEHSRESYIAAARQGAGILECDVTFTKDRELVCRHAQCDLHQTTNILATPLAEKCSEPFSPADPASGKKASAKCCTSDITLAEFKTLEAKMDGKNEQATSVEDYMAGTASWRTDLYSPGTVMSHAESIALFKELRTKFTPELKRPQVEMPFEGDYSQQDYADQLIREYVEAGVPASDVYAQSFQLGDVLHWIASAPDFGAQAVYLDNRVYRGGTPDSAAKTLGDIAAQGVKIIAPPTFALLALDDEGRIVPSAYAKAAKAADLDIITWTLERSGSLTKGGGWYYQTVKEAITKDSDMLVVLDVLAKEVGIKAIFTDWPETVTYYANCQGLP